MQLIVFVHSSWRKLTKAKAPPAAKTNEDKQKGLTLFGQKPATPKLFRAFGNMRKGGLIDMMKVKYLYISVGPMWLFWESSSHLHHVLASRDYNVRSFLSFVYRKISRNRSKKGVKLLIFMVPNQLVFFSTLFSLLKPTRVCMSL